MLASCLICVSCSFSVSPICNNHHKCKITSSALELQRISLRILHRLTTRHHGDHQVNHNIWIARIGKCDPVPLSSTGSHLRGKVELWASNANTPYEKFERNRTLGEKVERERARERRAKLFFLAGQEDSSQTFAYKLAGKKGRKIKQEKFGRPDKKRIRKTDRQRYLVENGLRVHRSSNFKLASIDGWNGSSTSSNSSTTTRNVDGEANKGTCERDDDGEWWMVMVMMIHGLCQVKKGEPKEKATKKVRWEKPFDPFNTIPEGEERICTWCQSCCPWGPPKACPMRSYKWAKSWGPTEWTHTRRSQGCCTVVTDSAGLVVVLPYVPIYVCMYVCVTFLSLSPSPTEKIKGSSTIHDASIPLLPIFGNLRW